MDAPQVTSAICCEVTTRIFPLFAIPKQRAKHSRDAVIPWQLHDCFRFGHPNQFRRLGAVAEILTTPVHKQIDRRAVDELETTIGNIFPMISRDTLSHY